MIPFELAEPRSLKKALALLDPENPAVRPIAGGTALMLMMKSGLFRPTRLVSLRRIEKRFSTIGRTADGRVRIGAQLCSAEGSLLNLDFARATLPGHLGPGSSADITLTLPPLDAPGRYTLKFDLVNEGVDWFEKCGSPTTTRTLIVV